MVVRSGKCGWGEASPTCGEQRDGSLPLYSSSHHRLLSLPFSLLHLGARPPGGPYWRSSFKSLLLSLARSRECVVLGQSCISHLLLWWVLIAYLWYHYGNELFHIFCFQSSGAYSSHLGDFPSACHLMNTPPKRGEYVLVQVLIAYRTMIRYRWGRRWQRRGCGCLKPWLVRDK